MNRPPQTKRAPRCFPAFGRCPDCTTPLQDWGTIFKEREVATALGCAMCEAVKFKLHSPVCLCADCANGVPKLHPV